MMLDTIIHFFRTHEILVWSVSISSLAVIIIGVLVAPWLVIRLPADCLVRPRRPKAAQTHPLLYMTLLFARNLLGLILVIAGIIMLLIPGQGILTIVIGIALLDFPRKRRLILWVLHRSRVLRSINWLRRRAGKPPLRMPSPDPISSPSAEQVSSRPSQDNA